MYNRTDQLQIIKSIRVKENDRLTLDCPFCGGRKKFTITRNDGKLLWNCYRNSCSVRGAYSAGRSVAETKAKLSGSATKPRCYVKPIPSILSQPENHPVVMDYLESVHSLEAYQNGLINIKYDPSTNRVLFFNNNNSGATGRALDSREPKWLTYGEMNTAVTVGSTKTGVIVEDVPSACAVAQKNTLTGIALLGTNVNYKNKVLIGAFDKVYLVLDKDASKKAVQVSKQLSAFVDVKLRLTNRDLKWLTSNEIQNVLQ